MYSSWYGVESSFPTAESAGCEDDLDAIEVSLAARNAPLFLGVTTGALADVDGTPLMTGAGAEAIVSEPDGSAGDGLAALEVADAGAVL